MAMTTIRLVSPSLFNGVEVRFSGQRAYVRNLTRDDYHRNDNWLPGERKQVRPDVAQAKINQLEQLGWERE